MEAAKFPLMCICGSMRFYEQMLKVAARLSYEGHIVLMPYLSRNMMARDTAPGTLEMLLQMQRERIRLSNGIFVVNCSLDETGNPLCQTYIGEHTMLDIAYGTLLDKRVEYLTRHIDSGLGRLWV